MASRKGFLRNAGNEDGSWTCNLCNKTFADKKRELMECEYCAEHYCSKCLNLSAAEYKLHVFSKRSDLHWYCPPCEEKSMKNLKIEKEIEERCKEYFSKYETMTSRKGSLRNAGNEDGSLTCNLCNKTFTDKKAELMESEYYAEHFCRKCLNLSAAEYKLLSMRSNLHW